MPVHWTCWFSPLQKPQPDLSLSLQKGQSGEEAGSPHSSSADTALRGGCLGGKARETKGRVKHRAAPASASPEPRSTIALALSVVITLTFLVSRIQSVYCFIFCHFHKALWVLFFFFFLHLCIVFLIITVMSTQLGVLRPGFQSPPSASTLRAPVAGRAPLRSLVACCCASPLCSLCLILRACAFPMLQICHLGQ